MNTTRTKAIARRHTLIFGLPGGILMFLALRTIPRSAVDSQSQYSFFFGDITSWPDIIKVGFLPLDFVLAIGWTMTFFISHSTV